MTLDSYLPWALFIFASLPLRSSLRTADAELPTFSTVRCKWSLLIPKCFIQYLTSSSRSIAILLRSREGCFLRETILHFQPWLGFARPDDNARAKKAFLIAQAGVSFDISVPSVPAADIRVVFVPILSVVSRGELSVRSTPRKRKLAFVRADVGAAVPRAASSQEEAPAHWKEPGPPRLGRA
jgi:hypothetical protein